MWSSVKSIVRTLGWATAVLIRVVCNKYLGHTNPNVLCVGVWACSRRVCVRAIICYIYIYAI